MWQPIETAPKDGTRVIVTYRECDAVDVAYWHDGHFCGVNDGWAPFRYWMPLPSPPEQTPNVQAEMEKRNGA